MVTRQIGAQGKSPKLHSHGCRISRSKLSRRDADVTDKLPRKIAKVPKANRFAHRHDILRRRNQELLRCVQAPLDYPCGDRRSR